MAVGASQPTVVATADGMFGVKKQMQVSDVTFSSRAPLLLCPNWHTGFRRSRVGLVTRAPDFASKAESSRGSTRSHFAVVSRTVRRGVGAATKNGNAP